MQLTQESLASVGSPSEAESVLDGFGADFVVLHGLGLPGQILVQASASTRDRAAAALGCNPSVSRYEPDIYVISVAAVNASDQLVEFSNFGVRSVDLAAPGLGILSTVLGGQYGRLNGDLDIDVIVTNGDNNSANVLLNNGSGVFSVGSTLTLANGAKPSASSLADFDNDHDLDLVIANRDTSSLTFFANAGNATSTAGATISSRSRVGNWSGLELRELRYLRHGRLDAGNARRIDIARPRVDRAAAAGDSSSLVGRHGFRPTTARQH